MKDEDLTVIHVEEGIVPAPSADDTKSVVSESTSPSLESGGNEESLAAATTATPKPRGLRNAMVAIVSVLVLVGIIVCWGMKTTLTDSVTPAGIAPITKATYTNHQAPYSWW